MSQARSRSFSTFGVFSGNRIAFALGSIQAPMCKEIIWSRLSHNSLARRALLAGANCLKSLGCSRQRIQPRMRVFLTNGYASYMVLYYVGLADAVCSVQAMRHIRWLS